MSLRWTLSFPVSIPNLHPWHRATLEENKLKIFKMCPETCLNLWLTPKEDSCYPSGGLGSTSHLGSPFPAAPLSLGCLMHIFVLQGISQAEAGRYSGIESRKCAQDLGRGRKMEVNREKHNAL